MRISRMTARWTRASYVRAHDGASQRFDEQQSTETKRQVHVVRLSQQRSTRSDGRERAVDTSSSFISRASSITSRLTDDEKMETTTPAGTSAVEHDARSQRFGSIDTGFSRQPRQSEYYSTR